MKEKHRRRINIIVAGNDALARLGLPRVRAIAQSTSGVVRCKSVECNLMLSFRATPLPSIWFPRFSPALLSLLLLFVVPLPFELGIVVLFCKHTDDFLFIWKYQASL